MFGFAKGTPNEDRLTAALFGLTHYLADPELLHPFLARLADANAAFSWQEERLPDEAAVLPWPTLEIPPHMGARFTKVEGAAKGTVTPDALIRLEWQRWGAARGRRTVWIYVEAEHSKAVEAEQLAQQWAVSREHHPASDELWLLLLNKTPTLPWPESTRPPLWPGAPPTLARTDLRGWCAHRAHFLRLGETQPDAAALPPEAFPALLHLSWQACADLVGGLERRSWAYRGLFAGLREYLGQAGYMPAVSWLDVIEVAPDKVLPDRHATFAGRLPEPFATDPDALFPRLGATLLGVPG